MAFKSDHLLWLSGCADFDLDGEAVGEPAGNDQAFTCRMYPFFLTETIVKAGSASILRI